MAVNVKATRCRCGSLEQVTSHDIQRGDVLSVSACAACHDSLLQQKNALVTENYLLRNQLEEATAELQRLRSP